MEIDGYTLENSVKLERAQTQAPDGADEATILAFYDKLGGLITKGGQKIKTGCFWDSKKQKAYAKPEVVYIYSVNGHIVEVPEGTELPGEVRAAKILEEEEGKKVAKPKAKKTTKAKAEAEEEDEATDGDE